MRIGIVGGGIIGLAVARRVSELRPDAGVTVLEKEREVASHQTGRNSGVVHAGIYYTPGSLKARLCRRGIDLLRAYCLEHEVPLQACGKLVVALDGGGELTVVEQNLETSSSDVHEMEGRRVRLRWSPDVEFVVKEGT